MSERDFDEDEMPSICPCCKQECDFRDCRPDPNNKARLICYDCWKDRLPNAGNDGYHQFDRIRS